MKRIIVASVFVFYLFVVPVLHAQNQEATPSAPPTKPALQNTTNEVENLKDKIASKVAELAKKNKKAVAGEVIEISKNIITLQTAEGTRYTIKTDPELTQFYTISGTTKKEVEVTDYEKGSYLIASGPISELEVSANFVYEDQEYIAESGKIVEVDKNAFVVRVLTQEKQEYMLDIESTTSQQILNIKTLGVEKIGFTKIKEGDDIHFIVEKGGGTTGNKNRYAATRILIIPQEYFLK